MLLGDWLILIGVTLITVGVTGLTLLETSRSPREGDIAMSDHGPRPTIRGGLSARLLQRRPGSGRAAALGTVAGLRVDAHDLTDFVCRLANGSMGRVAIIPGTDEEWTAVCVPA